MQGAGSLYHVREIGGGRAVVVDPRGNQFLGEMAVEHARDLANAMTLGRQEEMRQVHYRGPGYDRMGS